MLVFWKARLTFLAVPKTGSTAYERALGDYADMIVRDPPELKHAPIYRYNRFFRPMFEKQGAADMETLAIMREPIDWLSSWYRYRARLFMAGRPNSTENMSFDAFIRGYLQGKRPGFADVGSQAKFLEPRPNGTRINHLFRYDDLNNLNAFLGARLNIPAVTLTRENVSPKMDCPLADNLAQTLQRKCAQEFELYASIPDGGLHDQ